MRRAVITLPVDEYIKRSEGKCVDPYDELGIDWEREDVPYYRPARRRSGSGLDNKITGKKTGVSGTCADCHTTFELRVGVKACPFCFKEI